MTMQTRIRGPLHAALLSLRADMARAAQAVYDAWDQSDPDADEYAGGGICQDIAAAIADVIAVSLPDAISGTVSACVGEQHVWCVAYQGDEGYDVDIPYALYERGGGYSWTKVPGVEFTADDVSVRFMHPEEARLALEYEG
jgi:hypothetical protein